MEAIKIQGVKNTPTGGTHNGDAPPGRSPSNANVFRDIWSIVSEFEVWCNDGLNWYSVDGSSDKWRNVENMIDHSRDPDDPDTYDQIKKFETELDDQWTIQTVFMPPSCKKWL